jgi:acyl-CoA-binding protein
LLAIFLFLNFEMTVTMSLDEDFENGIEYVQKLPAKGPVQLSNAEKLKLYGLYKLGAAGECKVQAPSRLQVVNRAKWEAWNALGKSMTREQAKKKYLEELDKLSPNWRNSVNVKSKL